MTIGIVGSSFVVRKVSRNAAPSTINSNSIFTLALVTVLSSTLIEYLKREKYLPDQV